MHRKVVIPGGGGHRSIAGIICGKIQFLWKSYKKWGAPLPLSPHFSHLWYALTKMCVSSIENISFGKDYSETIRITNMCH